MKKSVEDERSGLTKVIGESHVQPDPTYYLKVVRDVFHEESNEYKEFQRILKDFKTQRLDIPSFKARIKELFKGHRSLLVGFNTFLPKDHEISLPPENDVHAGGWKPVDFVDAVKFVTKVKSRFQGDESVYKCFLQCLDLYGNQKKPLEVAHREIAALFCDHPDLQLEFTQLVPDWLVKTLEIRLPKYLYSGLPVENTENNSRAVKLEESDTYRELGREAIDMDGNNKRKGDRCGKGVACDSKDGLRDKDLEKHRPNIHNYETCTPSYRFLPKDYLIPLASCRTENDILVLNDSLVAVTSGSEDRSFKYMRKNPYEYSLFCCDDDRFELDMLLETVSATSMRVEKLMINIDKWSIPIRLEDYFTARNIRCIERLYGDHCLEVMDVLRKRPSCVLPVILTRLKQKQEEWRRCRTDFNVPWAEVYAKNYHKSLDYRGFYFKKRDIKSLSTKALLAEIKESSGLKREDDSVLRSLSDGKEHTVIPQLEFEYPDPNIHDDIYQLIKYSCGRRYTPKHLDKVMNIWMNFLEPMLGVPSRPDTSEDAEDVLHAKNSTSNCGDNRERHAIPSGSCDHSVGKKSSYSGREDETLSREKSTFRRESNGIRDGGRCCDTGISIPASSGNNNADVVSEVVTSNALEDPSCKRPLLSSSGPVPECIKIQRYQQVSVEEPKTEREEGELSPKGDFDEHNFAACSDSVREALRNSKDKYSGRQHEMRIGEEENNGRAVEEDDTDAQYEAEESAHALSDNNDADTHIEGKESVHRLSDDSASDSESGVLGSEYSDGENCSDEDGNDDVNDNMDEIEGVAEETNDGHGVLPFTKCIPPSSKRETSSRLFYGNDSFYVLFRLHHMMYERLQKAKLYSSSTANKWRIGNDTDSADRYARFTNALYNLLNGSFDQEKFEHDCHTILGAESYLLFTLDKLIFRIVKQLHGIATREINSRLIQLYSNESSRKSGTFMDSYYNESARRLLPDKNIFRLEYMPAAARLSIQLMKFCLDKADGRCSGEDVMERHERLGIFLRRNMEKHDNLDEDSTLSDAKEGGLFYNGLQIETHPKSPKVKWTGKSRLSLLI